MDSSTFIQLVIKLLPRSQKQLLTVHSQVQEKIWQNIPEAEVHTCFYFRLLLLCFTRFDKNVFYHLFHCKSFIGTFNQSILVVFKQSKSHNTKTADFIFIKSLFFYLEHAFHWGRYWSAMSHPEDKMKKEYKDCLLFSAMSCHYSFLYPFLSVHFLPFTFTF